MDFNYSNTASVTGYVGSVKRIEHEDGTITHNLSIATETFFFNPGAKEPTKELVWHDVRYLHSNPQGDVGRVLTTIGKGDFVHCGGAIRKVKWKDWSGTERVTTLLEANIFGLHRKNPRG